MSLDSSNLHVEGNTRELVLHAPDMQRKRAPWLLLATTQQATVAFALSVGYLADLERAFQEGKIADYPLFPAGRLVAGRAKVNVRDCINDRTVNDWARAVEERLGLTRVVGEGVYGWRRCFVDLFEAWSASARTKDLLSGHTDVHQPTHGSTRATVYLDPRDLVHRQEGQRLLEHVRTEFVRTGLSPAPGGAGAP